MGSFLWGPDASHVLHYHLFYHLNGKTLTTGDLSRNLGGFTLDHLKVKLNVSTYRHLAAAIGRHLVVGIMDDGDEEMTTGMDAMAGRQTTTSEAIYGLQPGEVGRINERILALFRAMARLWHARVLRLDLEGRVASLDQILHPNSTMDELAGKSSSGFTATDLHTLIDHLKTTYEDSVVKRIVPLLMEALEDKLADQFLGLGGTRNPFEEDSTDIGHLHAPMEEEPEHTPVQRRDKGKGKATHQVSQNFMTHGYLMLSLF